MERNVHKITLTRNSLSDTFTVNSTPNDGRRRRRPPTSMAPNRRIRVEERRLLCCIGENSSVNRKLCERGAGQPTSAEIIRDHSQVGRVELYQSLHRKKMVTV